MLLCKAERGVELQKFEDEIFEGRMRVVHFESDGSKFGAGFDFLLHDDGKIVFDV